MRRLLPLFLVLLLTLRGLLGDAMAMGTLPPVGAPEHAHATSAPHPVGHSMHPAADAQPALHHPGDHAPQAAAQYCNPGDASSAMGCDHAAGAPCSACGICHSAYSLPALQTPAAHVPPTAHPASATTRYASAPPQQLSKPPIS